MTSEQYKASLIEVQRDWSIDDVMDANEVLDLFEKLNRRLRDCVSRSSESVG